MQLLGEASVETLHDMLEEVWTSQEGRVCSLVSWERFSSLQQAQVLTVTHVKMYSVGHFIRYTCKIECSSLQQFRIYIPPVQKIFILLNYMLVIEVIVCSGVELDFIILRGVSNVFSVINM